MLRSDPETGNRMTARRASLKSGNRSRDADVLHREDDVAHVRVGQAAITPMVEERNERTVRVGKHDIAPIAHASPKPTDSRPIGSSTADQSPSRAASNSTLETWRLDSICRCPRLQAAVNCRSSCGHSTGFNGPSNRLRAATISAVESRVGWYDHEPPPRVVVAHRGFQRRTRGHVHRLGKIDFRQAGLDACRARLQWDVTLLHDPRRSCRIHGREWRVVGEHVRRYAYTDRPLSDSGTAPWSDCPGFWRRETSRVWARSRTVAHAPPRRVRDRDQKTGG